MNIEAHSLHKSDNGAVKAAGADLSLAAYTSDSMAVLTTAEAPGKSAAQKTVDKHFGHLEIAGEDQGVSSQRLEYANVNTAPEIRSVSQRVEDAPYPRIGQPWHPADAQDGLTAEQVLAEHSFVLSSVESLGLRWQTTDAGQGTELVPASIAEADSKRSTMLKDNPDMVNVVEIRYHDASPDTYPADSPFWQRGKDGEPIENPDYKQFQMLDWTNPQFQQHVVDQSIAIVKSGAADGVMLDWWNDGRDTPADKAAKMKMLEEIRQGIGPNALIMINTNEKTLPEVMGDLGNANAADGKPLVNGYYMECMNSATNDPKKLATEYLKEAHTIEYANEHTRSPQITVVENWHPRDQLRDDPRYVQEQEKQMRASTTMVMTLSNDYSVYADPDGMKTADGKSIPDHGHEIYPFYQADLGSPLSEKMPGLPVKPGVIEREFQNGTVVCNALGDKPVEVEFKNDRKQMSTGKIIKAGTAVEIEPLDGDIFVQTSI